MNILDCTLRDGGYYTNWDFNHELVLDYFNAVEKLPIEYIEIGYRSTPQKEYLGEYFYCPEYLLKKAKKIMPNKKLAIMLNEKDTKKDDLDILLNPCIGIISLVRMAVSPSKIEEAIEIAKEIKSRGFEVAFNVMYMSEWATDKSMINRFKIVNGVVDYFYMVDSFGGVVPDEVETLTRELKTVISCAIGFHGHNNLELGLANTLAAIKGGIDIIDATITGMGRGAGNLKTELLLTYLSSKHDLDVDFNALTNTVVEFETLQKNYQWGTNLPYMVSGANSLPQKDVMEWVTQRFYSIGSIVRALHNLKENQPDNIKLPIFNLNKKEKFKTTIIIGGGTSVVEHTEAILQFVEKNKNDICIIHASAKNAKPFLVCNVPQYFCLVGNESQRLERIFDDSISIEMKCILPAYPRKMGTYIPSNMKDASFELEKVEFTDKFSDSHFAIALQTSISLSVEKIYVVGYDGYTEQIGEKEKNLIAENNYLINKFSTFWKPLVSLTKSDYNGLVRTSIFSII